jgi:hypothetical protein
MKFKVGEIAVAVANGSAPMQECTILKLPSGFSYIDENLRGIVAGYYVIEASQSIGPDGTKVFLIPESMLRKRIDPQMPDEVRGWFDVPVKAGEVA